MTSEPSQTGYGPATTAQRRGNGLSIGAIVLGVIGVFFLPIVVGVIGIVLGGVAVSRREPLGKVGLGVAIAGTVLGLILGAVVFAASN